MQKQQLLSLLAIVATLSTLLLFAQKTQNPTLQLYQQWKADYGHSLIVSPEDNQYRFKIFEENLKEINQHNAKLGKSFTMGVNRFTGLTKQEFTATYLSSFPTNSEYDPSESTTPVNLNVDWVSYGAVSPVKDQGACLANYAFSAVGSIEGISAIYYKTQQEFSAQQIVDCSSAYGNKGCNGGSMTSSFNFVATRGINTQNAYPYTARLGTCRSTSGLFRIAGYVDVTSCAALDYALGGRPISVAVDGANFRNYRGGIFDQCGTNLSLAGLLVGGTDLYYKLKLSWGSLFGEYGYIRLLKTNNICGICQASSYAQPA